MLDGIDFTDDPVVLDRVDTLRGDVRDRLLDQISALKKPYGKLGQFDQEHVIAAVNRIAAVLVRDVVRLVAGQGRTTIEAMLDSVTIKDGIVASLKLSRGSVGRYDLIDAVKKEVQITVVDTEQFDGESGAAEAELDEPALPLDDALDLEGEAPQILGVGDLPCLPEARRIGREDGEMGVRDHAARYPSGEVGHADYELGHADGMEVRRATLEMVRDEDADRDRAGTDEGVRPDLLD